MENWRRLMNEGAFQEARAELERGRVQMTEGRRDFLQGLERARHDFEEAERKWLAELEKALAEIAEKERRWRG